MTLAVDALTGFILLPWLGWRCCVYWAEQFRRWLRAGEWRTMASGFVLASVWPLPILFSAAFILVILFAIRVFAIRIDPLKFRRFAMGVGICGYWLWLNSIPWPEGLQIVAEFGATVFLLMGGPYALQRMWRRRNAGKPR